MFWKKRVWSRSVGGERLDFWFLWNFQEHYYERREQSSGGGGGRVLIPSMNQQKDPKGSVINRSPSSINHPNSLAIDHNPIIIINSRIRMKGQKSHPNSSAPHWLMVVRVEEWSRNDHLLTKLPVVVQPIHHHPIINAIFVGNIPCQVPTWYLVPFWSNNLL